MVPMKKSLCFFCDKEAIYFDVVLNDKGYIVADVCSSHVSVEYVS